jgi:hypothetical protein
MTVQDFTAEQEYHVGKNWLQNRLIFGAGVVMGLECSIERGRLAIQPGVAMDCLGREIVVTERQRIDVPEEPEELIVSLFYEERKVAFVPAIQGGDLAQEIEATMIEEGFKVVFGDESSTADHVRRGKRWKACGEDHPVPLARLRRMRGGLRVRPVRAAWWRW